MRPTQRYIDAITLALKILKNHRQQYSALVKNKYDDDIKILEELLKRDSHDTTNS